MATAADYKSVLDLAKMGLELGLSAQEAVDEANAQFQADTRELQRVIQQHNIVEAKALEHHGYKPQPPPIKLALAPAYMALEMGRDAAMTQASKHFDLCKARSEIITAAIQANIDRAERERQHEETMGKLRNEEQQLEVQKMDIQHKENTGKRKHDETMTQIQLELVRASKRPNATFPTLASVDHNTFCFDLMRRSKVVERLEDMFDMIHACISDKLTRRSHATTVTLQAGTPEQPQQHYRAMRYEGGDVPPMIVSNKCNESVQYAMLQAFNDGQLQSGHFEIIDDSNVYVIAPEDKVDHVVMWRGDQHRATKSPLNAAFVVEQKPAKPTPADTLQLLRYLYHILHGTGPEYANADLVCRRTHVMGILVYRTAATERDPIPPADTLTTPHVEVKPPQLNKEDNQKGKRGRRTDYSRLVADVYVLFHPSIMPEPHLLRLAEPGIDAAPVRPAGIQQHHVRRHPALVWYELLQHGDCQSRFLRLRSILGHGSWHHRRLGVRATQRAEGARPNQH